MLRRHTYLIAIGLILFSHFIASSARAEAGAVGIEILGGLMDMQAKDIGKRKDDLKDLDQQITKEDAMGKDTSSLKEEKKKKEEELAKIEAGRQKAMDSLGKINDNAAKGGVNEGGGGKAAEGENTSNADNKAGSDNGSGANTSKEGVISPEELAKAKETPLGKATTALADMIKNGGNALSDQLSGANDVLTEAQRAENAKFADHLDKVGSNPEHNLSDAARKQYADAAETMRNAKTQSAVDEVMKQNLAFQDKNQNYYNPVSTEKQRFDGVNPNNVDVKGLTKVDAAGNQQFAYREPNGNIKYTSNEALAAERNAPVKVGQISDAELGPMLKERMNSQLEGMTPEQQIEKLQSSEFKSEVKALAEKNIANAKTQTQVSQPVLDQVFQEKLQELAPAMIQNAREAGAASGYRNGPNGATDGVKTFLTEQGVTGTNLQTQGPIGRIHPAYPIAFDQAYSAAAASKANFSNVLNAYNTTGSRLVPVAGPIAQTGFRTYYPSSATWGPFTGMGTLTGMGARNLTSSSRGLTGTVYQQISSAYKGSTIR